MPSSTWPGPRALIRVKLGGKTIPLVPYCALRYFAISLVVVALALLTIDLVLIPAAVRGDFLTSPEWYEENARINRNNNRKNRATAANPLWRSAGHPVGPREPGTRRILVLGDSFVWGDGYANMNHLWWRQLDRELERRGYGRFEVVAGGMCGWSTAQQLAAAPALVAALAPDLLVWGFVVNDPDAGLVRLVARGDRPTAATPRRGLAGQIERIGRADQAPSPDPAIAHSNDELFRKLLAGESWQRYRETVAGVARFQEKSGLPGFVIELPTHPGPAYRPLFAQVGALFREMGLSYVEVLPRLFEAAPDGHHPSGDDLAWGINPVNAHPAAATARVYAAAAADYIERSHPDLLPRVAAGAPERPIEINDWMPHDAAVERLADDRWQLRFPLPERRYSLSLPHDAPYVQLSFATPAAFRRLSISGAGLRAATLHLTASPELGAIDATPISLAEQRGASLRWDLDDELTALPIDAVRISARFEPEAPRILRVQLDPENTSARR